MPPDLAKDPRRLRLAALALGAGLLAARAGVPLYDGLGFPDQPYRFAGTSPPPSNAVLTDLIKSGRAAGGVMQSAENGPQIVVRLSSAAVTTAAVGLTVVAQPLTPDGLPPDGTFDSNAYRLAVLQGPSVNAAVAHGSIDLRAAVMTKPAPRVLFRPDPAAAWREIKTHTSGRDILSASLQGVGDYVLERPAGSKPTSVASYNKYVPALLGVLTVGVFWVGSAFLRRRHSDSTDEDGDSRTL